MTRTLLTAAAALMIAAPALAASQLETKLGVAPGTYTTAELVALQFGQDHDTGDGARVSIDVREPGMIVSTSNRTAGSTAERVRAHFAQDHDTGDGPRYVAGETKPATVIVSTSNSSRADAVRRHFAQDQGNDNSDYILRN